ncbi:FkbM family methyltransferase [Sphingomonas xinjiangensis]|uniref:FkbM family methyltransferase n=1 Tax=Sphingomonas xinjiangensis TaxID=643568 RepID=A0A840YSY1_9SPHN|nr:FkbM family methyltransferase [Sphingomonas xinjiangensis]
MIDVGANSGQYARSLREGGYDGPIYSIEPLPDAFATLSESMNHDPLWSGMQAAAGSAPGRASINVSADSVCSSLLKPTASLIDAIPTAQIVKQIEVEVIRLDAVDLPKSSRIALKLDVQGFEKQALEGASALLSRIAFLEMELALEPGYEGAYTLSSALPEIEALGFEIASVGRGYSDPVTGRLIDMDVLFEHRR